MKRTILCLSILTCILSSDLFAQKYLTREGTATFHSNVPLYSFSGTSPYLTGMINTDNKIVDFYLDLTTLDSGLEKRDRDMQEVLGTDQFPFAEFYGELTTSFDPSLQDSQKVTVKGNFKIHGVSREVEIPGTLTPTKEGIHLYATWILKLEDYDIVPPKLLFVKVDQEQRIEIEGLLKPTDD